MSKVPFERFILIYLILGKDIKTIVSKLQEFHYHITDDEITEIFDNFKSTLSPALKLKIDNKQAWNIEEEQDKQWLTQYRIYEYYDYMLRRLQPIEDPPPYFKWFRDCLWIHAWEDIQSLVNIFMFNGESLESISNIISFKYKRKIGIEALERYKLIYWDCDIISSKEALYHCIPFRKNALIIKNIKYANVTTITKLNEDEDDGSDVNFVFHDNNYIKWKIGYNDIKIPNTKDFMEKIKQDSYYKYYETMNMSQSAEVEEEVGQNDFGPFDKRTVKRRNVEEQKAKAAKHWMELFLKADESMPVKDEKNEGDFFDKMEQIGLEFGEEKIVSINDVPNIKSDIAKDKM